MALVAAVVGVVALAGVAFACTPKPQVFALDAAAARPGEQVVVSGTMPPTPGATGALAPIQIRWDATDGPVLAEVPVEPGGSFTATITVPQDAEPGWSYIAASADDQATGVARAALEVTGDAQAVTASSSPWDLSSDLAATQAAGQGISAPVAAGAGMLGLGLVGLFAGAATAAVSARPVLARRD